MVIPLLRKPRPGGVNSDRGRVQIRRFEKCELPWSLPPAVEKSRQPPRTSDLLPLLPLGRCSLGGTSKTKKTPPGCFVPKKPIWRPIIVAEGGGFCLPDLGGPGRVYGGTPGWSRLGGRYMEKPRRTGGTRGFSGSLRGNRDGEGKPTTIDDLILRFEESMHMAWRRRSPGKSGASIDRDRGGGPLGG